LRKSRIISACVAVAALAVPSVASANVARQCTTTVESTTTATFNATQPSGAGGNWVHHFTVTVKSDRTFSGTNVITGMDYNGPATVNETVTGSFGKAADGITDTITVHAVRPVNLYTDAWSVADAPMDGVADRMDVGTVSNATANGVTWDLPITFTAPQFLTVDGGTDYANHGEYVEAMGGGKIAAQKCVGMPIKSKAPKA